MDFDKAKENIQPLRQGRRADRLELALSEQSKESLENEKRQYEEAISKYEGLDPLSAWYEYICWIEQSYPKGGSESGLDDLVLKCIIHFEAEPKYKQDRRMIKLYIKYIDTQKNQNECYSQLYNSGIGTMVADLYIAWSYYFDALNNYKEVEAIFRKGLDAGAQPHEELAHAHQAFGISMSRRMLYDDETSQQQFQASMAEKRSALTSLRAHKKKFVGSLRTGIAVKDDCPGVVNQENVGLVANKSKFDVLNTDEELAPQALPANTSVIRSIVDNARKNENIHEPGPWNQAKMGKSGGIFGKGGASNHLDFDIMEDDNLPPIPCPEKLFEKGIQLPSGFISRNKPQEPWDIPMVVPEPLVPRSVPCYEKFLLYPNDRTEISPDEYRAYKWFKERNMKTSLTEQYDKIWANDFETGIRLPPGFQICNVKQVEKEEFERIMPDIDCEHVQLPLHRMYFDEGEELSLEELLAEKYREGKIKVLTEEDFVEIDGNDNMDITLIGDRRQSFYPASRQSFVPRKSIMPRKSVIPPATVQEKAEEPINVEEVKSLGAIRKSTIKRKSSDDDDKEPTAENMRPLLKKELVCATPPRHNFNVFKPPAPVEKKIAYPFTVDEEDPNDTCSTMQFNFFLKAQSVSTPVSKKNLPKLTPLPPLFSEPEVHQQQNETNSRAEAVTSSSQHSVTAPISTTQVQENCPPKQLSTIMETTESTQSTKSSVGNDTEFTMKTIHTSQRTVTKQESENKLLNPLLASFRLGEEQTETFSTMPVPLPVRMIPQSNVSQFIPETPIKVREMSAFQIFEDDSLPLPPPDLGLSTKSHGSSNSSKHTEVTQIEIAAALGIEDDVNVSCLAVPTQVDDTHCFEIPATQEVHELEIPTQLDDTHYFEIPATQEVPELEIPTQLDDTHYFEIPATQEVLELEIPATQDSQAMENDDIDIPATQHLQFPADSILGVPATTISDSTSLDSEIAETQEKEKNVISSSCSVYTISSESHSFPNVETSARKKQFFIYEDSVREDIQSKPPIKASTAHVVASDSLAPPSTPIVRTPSEEFLAICKSPISTSKRNATTVGHQNEMSDLLKFSNVTASEVPLERSLKNLTIEAPKSATPTYTITNFFDDDLNTEKFGLPLGCAKNSTLISSQKQSPQLNEWGNNLDISISIDDDEMARLGLAAKPKEAEDLFKVPGVPEFKPPSLPTALPFKAHESIHVYEDSDDDENDLSRSIYKPKPKPQAVAELEDDVEFEGQMMCSFLATPTNKYEHTICYEPDQSIRVQEMIRLSNGNPFDDHLREVMLEHCNFSQYLESNVPNCTLLKTIPQLKTRAKIQCKDNEYTVVKSIGKGAFGAVYTAKSAKDGEVYAMKQEMPPNLWEFYICLELTDRLKQKRMIPAFMNINYAIIAHNSSILVTQYSPYGTIIDVCNKHKNITNKHVDEYVVMVLTTQLLSIMDHLHSCKIIHADIKPDNFLVMSKIEHGMKVPALQLIDFGSAIDMDWYNGSDAFTYVVKTENFTCCEMLENKPWTYQTDLFGLCGTSHVLLFGQYMKVEKKILTWNITTRFPRYFNKPLWEQFFNVLLNIQSCTAMPNLQALKDLFEDFIQSKQKFVQDKIVEFNKVLDEN